MEISLSMYPTMLEFSVEATYPNDEAIVTAVIMVLSAIQGVIVIELQQVFATEYVPKEGIEVRLGKVQRSKWSKINNGAGEQIMVARWL